MRWRRCHGGGEVLQTAAVVVNVHRGGQASEVRSVTRLLSLFATAAAEFPASLSSLLQQPASQPARQGFGR
jgi:hypothetical protein